MSQREMLIERLKTFGYWSKLTPAQQKDFEQYDEKKANSWMWLEDALDCDLNCTVQESAQIDTIVMLIAMVDLCSAFDGKLVQLGPAGVPNDLSDMGRALANFIAAADAAGIHSLEGFRLGLASITLPCLVMIRRKASANAGDDGLSE